MRAARCTGFTLIEILVAMAIISVLSVVLVLAGAPGEASACEDRSAPPRGAARARAGRARANGQSIAWSPSPDGYAFLHKGEDGEWQSFPADSPYRRRSLPAGVSLGAVQLDAQPLRRRAHRHHALRPGCRHPGDDHEGRCEHHFARRRARPRHAGSGALLHDERPRIHASWCWWRLPSSPSPSPRRADRSPSPPTARSSTSCGCSPAWWRAAWRSSPRGARLAGGRPYGGHRAPGGPRVPLARGSLRHSPSVAAPRRDPGEHAG